MARHRAPRLEFARTRLLVKDFRAAWGFYRDVLGLIPVRGHGAPPYGEFQARGAMIALFERGRMAPAIGLSAGRYSRRSVGQSALVLEAADVDRVARALRAKGVPLVAGPTDRPDWQIRTIHFRDPDGYLIEVYSRPKGAA